jgi:hypothetical protein
VHVPRAFVHQAQLDQAIHDLEPALGTDVIRLKYTLGEDWSGESAIFFKILLSDWASRRDQLRNVTAQVTDLIVQRLQPLEQWDVLPYFSFRSESEQAALKEEAWA